MAIGKGVTVTFIRATYGAINNSHGLLKSDCKPELLPAALANMTDRPHGDFSPGEIWYPSVGCGPVDDWWCLWWTTPDNDAIRAGMVRSEVALWKSSDIISVSDLVPVLRELSGKASIKQPPNSIIIPFASALLKNPDSCVAVCETFDYWPGIIARIWSQLWPDIKATFSARVALSPPQNIGINNITGIFAIPSNREYQWPDSSNKVRLSVLDNKDISVNRAARYIAGIPDKLMDEVLLAIPPKAARLNFLQRVVRVADGLEAIQTQPTFSQATALLRTLIALTEPGRDTSQFISLALQAMTESVHHATAPELIAIANIDITTIAEHQEFEGLVKQVISKLIPSLNNEENSSLLERLEPGSACKWWKKLVLTVISEGIASSDLKWLETITEWLALQNLPNTVTKIVPTDFESAILDSVNNKSWSEPQIQQIRLKAIEKKWSILHAWSIYQPGKANIAFDLQYSFKGDPNPGLAWLSHQYSAEEVVTEAISRSESELIKLAAQKTVESPESLNLIDIYQPESRQLWSMHINNGGEVFPTSLRRKEVEHTLLNVLISGEDTFDLIQPMAKYLTLPILEHENRNLLWSKLTISERDKLLPEVACEFINLIEGGRETPLPEPEVFNAIAKKLCQSRPSTKVICTVLDWAGFANEQNIIEWIKPFSANDWIVSGTSIGQAALRNNWGLLAKELEQISKIQPEAKPAADVCASLIPPPPILPSLLDTSLFFSMFNFGHTKPKQLVESHEFQLQVSNQIANQVSDIGAILRPEGPEFVWERIGGNIAQLHSNGTGRDKWQHAARQAASGAVRGGLLALICELLNEFPENSKLKELEALLSEK